MADRTEQLRKIKDEVLVLKKLPLYQDRVKNANFPVIGEGSHYAKIVFIGEAPGKNEALTGRPFVGVAGKFLNELLASAEIKREAVYITNIVKDRPPFNRDPLPSEIEIYGPFLDRQIEIIKPKVVATLGRFSMQYIMNRYGLSFECASISQIHGQVFSVPDETLEKLGFNNVKVVPLYHPAAAIYNQHLVETLKEDFKVLKTLI